MTMEREIKTKQIKVISISDMQVIQMKLYLSMNQDRVSQKASKVVAGALAELNDLDKSLSKTYLNFTAPKESLTVNKISL